VDTKFWNQLLGSSLVIAATMLAGCATPPAKNFGGSWKPLNRFRAQPTEIPLQAAYTFYAAPMDETLKTMLTRWANDSGRTLSYQLPFDVTLYTPVADIRTTDLGVAARQLTNIYTAQHVYVSANDRKIVVLPSNATEGSATDAKAPPPVSMPKSADNT
jgi:hypothetical protein